MTARVAAIDIGTNSVLLLVADADPRGLIAVAERATITRLGEGVDATHALAPEAVDRTLACLTRYAAEFRALGATSVGAVGTSAMRDAQGGAELRERARAILGVAPVVISGDEEASLTFEGALAGLELDSRQVTVFDLGGGSTEIVRGTRFDASDRARRPSSEDPRSAVSLDVGSVRLTERHVRSDPPAEAELDAIRAAVRAALNVAERTSRLARPDAGSGLLVGVAGTVTTIAAHVLGVAPYDASRIHGARLSAAAIGAARATLAGMPLRALRTLPTIPSARADVIVAGCVIVEELLAWAGATELVVSDRGVRWGLAARLARSDQGSTFRS